MAEHRSSESNTGRTTRAIGKHIAPAIPVQALRREWGELAFAILVVCVSIVILSFQVSTTGTEQSARSRPTPGGGIHATTESAPTLGLAAADSRSSLAVQASIAIVTPGQVGVAPAAGWGWTDTAVAAVSAVALTLPAAGFVLLFLGRRDQSWRGK